jgi:hypothetical protein
VTRRTAGRLLWIVTLLTLPVPFYLGEPELAPVVRLAFLSALMSAVLVAEGGGTLGVLAGLGIAQTLLYAVVFRLVAAWVARGLDRLPAPRARSAVVVIVAIVLFAVSLAEIYDTPLSSTRPRSNLTHIFE